MSQFVNRRGQHYLAGTLGTSAATLKKEFKLNEWIAIAFALIVMICRAWYITPNGNQYTRPSTDPKTKPLARRCDRFPLPACQAFPSRAKLARAAYDAACRCVPTAQMRRVRNGIAPPSGGIRFTNPATMGDKAFCPCGENRRSCASLEVWEQMPAR